MKDLLIESCRMSLRQLAALPISVAHAETQVYGTDESMQADPTHAWTITLATAMQTCKLP